MKYTDTHAIFVYGPGPLTFNFKNGPIIYFRKLALFFQVHLDWIERVEMEKNRQPLVLSTKDKLSIGAKYLTNMERDEQKNRKKRLTIIRTNIQTEKKYSFNLRRRL